jgi:hypothetical protein
VQLVNSEKQWVDVLVFEKECVHPNLKTASIEKLRQSVQLYWGEFLEDFYVPEPPFLKNGQL